MKRCNLDRAMKLAAKTQAYDWYCRFHEIDAPDFATGVVDQRLVHRHGQAWAWAERHWEEFVGQIDDEDSRFLRQLVCGGRTARLGRTVPSIKKTPSVNPCCDDRSEEDARR